MRETSPTTSRQEPLAPWTIQGEGVQAEGALHLPSDDAGRMLTALPESRKLRSSCDSIMMGRRGAPREGLHIFPSRRALYKNVMCVSSAEIPGFVLLGVRATEMLTMSARSMEYAEPVIATITGSVTAA